MTAPTQQPTSRTGSQQTGADRHTLTDRSFHLIGIGGAGMSVVAQLLAARGARVSGSDAHGSPAFDHLSDLGITTHLGHDAANVPVGSTVVVSTAIKGTNPELAEARRRDQEVIHRSQALALAAQGLDFVAVAGAHGKTTTSGMLAEALTVAGADPSFAIGGVVRALGTGAHLGGGSALVAEADESDRSFLNYTPRVEIVTNVEPDHLDTYGTAEAFEAAFVDFAHRLVPGGLLVACAADPGSLRLARTAAAEGLRVVTYSFGGLNTLPGGMLVGEGHVHLTIQERGAASTRARLTLIRAADQKRSGSARAGESAQNQVELVLAVPGDHMALNAAGAWAAGIELGVEPAEMARALGSFGGTGRRFEDRGQADGVRVVDDYAHHPTEIEVLLRTAREVAQERAGRILVLFQPHLFSRTRAFADRFGQALSLADVVVIADVYPAREVRADFPDVTGDTVARRVPGGRATFIADRLEAAHALAAQARPGDLLLTVGAGDVTELATTVLSDLVTREGGAAGSPTQRGGHV